MSHLPTLGACNALMAFPGSVSSRLGGYGVTRGSLSSAGSSASDEQGPHSIEKTQTLGSRVIRLSMLRNDWEIA